MNLTLIDLFIFCGGFFITLYLYGSRTYDHFKNKDVKCVKPPLPFFGSGIWVFLGIEHFQDFILRCYNTCKDDKYLGLFEVQRPIILIKDVEILKLVGIEDFDSFPNHRSIISEEIDPLFGSALISLEDQKWRNMRATLSPAFASSKMKNMFVLVEEIAKEFSNFYVEQSKNAVDKTTEIEANDSFIRYTNDVIATCAFGIKMNSMKNTDHKFYKLEKIGGWLLIKFTLLIYFPMLAKFFKMKFFPKKVVSFFRNLLQCTMKSREKMGIIRYDLINILMEVKTGSLKHEESIDESSEAGIAIVEESIIENEVVTKKWNDDELAAQAMTFFLGGFETTSTLIIFFFYEMARNPDIQKKVQEEIDNLINESSHGIVYTDLMQLKYLDMAVSETLRMWPPILITDRVCAKDYTLPPANDIKKGESIWIPIYGFHHDPKHFPEPDCFNPERFSVENKSNINPMTYLPFGIGPRNCIGSRFALLVAKLIIFHTLAKFEIVVTKNTQIPIILTKTSTSLMSDKGMYVGLKLRKS
ncbi:cytochrome P450 9e2-like isoform X2 [Arctopsyche grandis]|uniref:cytochrome P450 9e2-like isoform X2 n=1 Tax=Arctopsyche grandis TaxID=121162 RepID=UPI00406D8A6D